MNTVYTLKPANKSRVAERTRLEPVARQGLAEQVYNRLLESILHGELSSGTELTEVELARRLNVSRTPVREAVRRLAAEGLIVVSRNLRCHVAPFSRQDIIDTYEVRQLLEAEAARRAASRMTDATLQELAELAQAASPHSGDDWESRERKFDARLHEAIGEAAENARLREEILRFTRQVQMVRVLVGRDPERLEQGHKEHLAILAALQAHDETAAHQAMSAHLEASLSNVLQELPTQ